MSARTCPSCGGPLVEIVVSEGESPLVMRSCGKCDEREWSREGKDVDLTTALRELSESGQSRRRRR